MERLSYGNGETRCGPRQAKGYYDVVLIDFTAVLLGFAKSQIVFKVVENHRVYYVGSYYRLWAIIAY